MKILELFAGSCSFSNVAKKYKFETFTTDHKVYDTKIDYVTDIMNFNLDKVPYKPDIIWASPPCTTFSISSCMHHWTKPDKQGNRSPKSKEAEEGLKILEATLKIIFELQPTFWFIENPRGIMRKMDILQNLPRTTVTYCQYGDNRMKPTDIWTNSGWTGKKMCKNGDTCHEAAPRGSRTGTQGLKNAFEKSKVPDQLCDEILSYCFWYGVGEFIQNEN